MRFIIPIILSVFAAPSFGAQWFLAREATGTGAGTSWANAWVDPTNIVWPSIAAGDTLWISGGPAGGTNNYVGYISTSGKSANSGTAGNKITISTAKDSSHNGLVKLWGGVYIDRDYYTLDGSLTTNWIPASVMDTYRIGTNCNWEVAQTNNDGNHGINFGSCKGQLIKWMHVSAAATHSLSPSDVNALQLNGNSGGSMTEGCEVEYCWLANAWGYGFFMLGPRLDAFAQCSIHHCLIEGVHDNYIESDGSLDVYNNVGWRWAAPTVGHPDIIQGITSCTRIWGNIFQDCPGTSVYIEPIGMTLVHDVFVYNNLFLTTTQVWHDGITITGAALTDKLTVSNLWFFNNTFDDPNGASVFTWNGGLNTVNGTVATNIHFLNNAIILTNNATTPVLNFFTNLVFDNDTRGFAYAQTTNGVEVNFNNVAGATSGNGNGIRYGAHGDYYDAGYSTMTAFASDYPKFSSNNNVTPGYVSLPNGDFRPGADTALKGLGTNLIAALTNVCPGCGTDLIGNARPLSGAWDIGAYQSDPTLLMWFTFNAWAGQGTTVNDDSGYTNHAFTYSALTNSPSLVTNGGINGAAALFSGEWPWPGPPAETGGSIQFLAVTNCYGLMSMTNGSMALWVWYMTNSSRLSVFFDSGYPDKDNSWQFGRNFAGYTAFKVWTNSQIIDVSAWPDTVSLDVNNFQIGTGAWHHYAQTFTNNAGIMTFISYYDGVPVFTNTAKVPSLDIKDIHYLGISMWKHQSGPALDPAGINPPNVGWFGGELDDLRIYNRPLSPTEVFNLFSGAGAQTSGGSSGGGGGSTAIGSISMGAGIRMGAGVITR